MMCFQNYKFSDDKRALMIPPRLGEKVNDIYAPQVKNLRVALTARTWGVF